MSAYSAFPHEGRLQARIEFTYKVEVNCGEYAKVRVCGESDYMD